MANGREMLMAARGAMYGGGGIDYGTPLEYIERTWGGSDRFDTSILPDSATSMESKFEFIDYPKASMFFTTDSLYGDYCLKIESNTYIFNRINIARYDSFSKFVFKYDANSKKINVKDLDTGTDYEVANKNAISPSSNLKILGSDNGRDSIPHRFYYMKITKNGTLVRDYVPCLDLDNRIALFDFVSKSHFYTLGTGSNLVAGPIIT